MALSRRKILALVGIGVAIPGGLVAALRRPFPSDRTAEGAYMRIARGVMSDDPKSFFAYLETEAQWACFTLHEMRKKASEKIRESYPEPRRAELLASYAPLADAADGSDAFAHVYRTREWARRLRKDLSGVARVDVDEAEGRASVVTVRGTRWPFRRRDNGIWGITVFTAELVADAEKATRDLAVVESAAADYERVKRGG